MSKYHVNPKTGTPSVCRATQKRGCPFEGVSEHYDTPEEARKDYEKTQEKINHLLWKTKVPQAEGAIAFAAYDPMDEDVPLPGTMVWGAGLQRAAPDPLAVKFFKAMEKAPNKALLVMEDGTIFQKNSLFGDDSWALRTQNSLLRLEVNSTYSSAYFLGHLKSTGGRLETLPKRFYPSTNYLAGLGRKVDPNSLGYKAYSDADLAKAFAKEHNDSPDKSVVTPELQDIEDEVQRRKKRQSSLIEIDYPSMIAKPVKNLSLEGITSY